MSIAGVCTSFCYHRYIERTCVSSQNTLVHHKLCLGHNHKVRSKVTRRRHIQVTHMSRQKVEQRARLLVEPVDGHSDLGQDDFKTIHDVTFDVLASRCENAMVVLCDRKRNRVLLEVPNRLGWRLHFGCTVPDCESSDEALCEDALWTQAREIATAAITDAGVTVVDRLRAAGIMFFTFQSDHPPMRVRVFEGKLGDDGSDKVGRFYNFDEVPYHRMWADDVVWMPCLLQSEESYFEGHFVFDGEPSAASHLIQHNCNFM
mmetsp:Transcript_19377/g.42413  ORF Transcript_19377/g.42413 Transcript_19377/m.42413 type:complete len:260 (+) Transcript_19377:147-926(+)